MIETKQKQMLKDIRACRKQVFKLVNQFKQLKKKKKLREAAVLNNKINALIRFLKEMHYIAFI